MHYDVIGKIEDRRSFNPRLALPADLPPPPLPVLTGREFPRNFLISPFPADRFARRTLHAVACNKAIMVPARKRVP